MRGAALWAAALLLPACEYTSTTVMVASVVQAPVPQLQGGTVPVVVTASVHLEQRDLTGSSVEPIPGATVTLSVGGQQLALQDQGDGGYGLTSNDNPKLVYQPQATYAFTASTPGGTFQESVVAPDPEQVPVLSELTPEAVVLPDGTTGPTVPVLPLNPGVDLMLVRSDSTGLDPAAVVITSASPGSSGALYAWPTLDASGLEDFFLHPATYEASQIQVPNSVWDQCEIPYLIVSFTALARGSQQGDNLSIGSLVQAGSSQAVLAHCEAPAATQP